ncbi:MAG: hypothetical protein R3190_18605 [Thermoanaerobaculia bacterium]|nr:hypothetical protein [Thermoanaerobaculia bacterium]
MLLAIWAGGIAAGAALVATWDIVGPGYLWLSAGVGLLLAVPAAFGAGAAWVGVGFLVAAGALARRPNAAAITAAAAAVVFVVVAAVESPVLAVSGALFLGGVTTEMMLGHWYLVDPRLPRSALRSLAVIGAAGAAVDGVAAAVLGAVPWPSTDEVMGWAFLVLAATTTVLMAAVWLALRERGYAAVMAATGLSYLALLTAIGAAALGRALI